MNNNTLGLALLCNTDGIITNILSNPAELKLDIQPGKLFARLVAPGSLGKALSFLTEIQSSGTAFNHEINVLSADHAITLRFVGGTVNDALLIVGCEDGTFARKLYEEMMRINNEQTNSLRSLLKDQSRSDDTLYNELSRLNNELVATQREIAKKNAELERLNKEKNHFLGMAAHELRNPLHTILSYSDFLFDTTDNPEQQEFLQVIRDVSHFSARLVDDLLDVSKIEAGDLQLEYEPVKLVQLIERNTVINRPLAARKQIELSYHLDKTTPTALVDAPKLEQVLNNLIGNAIKFSQPGSTVTISLANEDDTFLITVADNGSGIAPKQKTRMFQPFQPGQKGTGGEQSIGLGLAIVKRIVEGHGGQIWFESELGQGTTFFVRIPLQPGDGL